MTLNKYPRSAIHIFVWLGIVLATVSTASAGWKEKVLYSFQGYPDGATPVGGVVFDKHGNLYGASGGGSDSCPSTGDCGVVYQLSPSKQQRGAWIESVLYTFKGYNQGDGATPGGGLILDAAGNLYGVTAYGGTGNCAVLGTTMGCGSVFRLTPPKTKGETWTENVLYSFQGNKDGQFPIGDLVFDQNGNLYGATYFGGGYGSCDAPYYRHCGTVFELIAPKNKGEKWTEKVLYSFRNGADGAAPNGGLVFDQAGAIYGTTYSGGKVICPGGQGPVGCGVVFKLTSRTKGQWIERLVYRFGKDAYGSTASVVFDAKGNLYGSTTGGGTGEGALFRLTPPQKNGGVWIERVIHRFTFGADGGVPRSALALEASGNLVGAASQGTRFGGGTVFELMLSEPGPRSPLIPLHAFKGSPDGAYPVSRLTFDAAGFIYGTTQFGGTGQNCQGGCGTVFEVSP